MSHFVEKEDQRRKSEGPHSPGKTHSQWLSKAVVADSGWESQPVLSALFNWNLHRTFLFLLCHVLLTTTMCHMCRMWSNLRPSIGQLLFYVTIREKKMEQHCQASWETPINQKMYAYHVKNVWCYPRFRDVERRLRGTKWQVLVTKLLRARPL